MTDDLLCDMPATELARAIRERAVSPVEAAEAVLARMERINPLVNAFVTVTAEQALAAAREAERQVTVTPAEQLAPLHGVPITVKDLTDTAGVRTTYGSVAFKDHVPERDTLAWSRLKAAGAVLVGKTCTPEFGMLGVTESPLTGITNNPWDVSRTAGGSSGGAAAAVASGLAPLAWGSDGGGSIRVPASCCGVVGLKASTGRIPVHGEADVYGLVSTSGPLTRTVADAALMLQVTAGPDPHEPMALPAPLVPFTEALRDASVRGLRVAFSPDFGQGPIDPDVRDRFEQALRVSPKDLGAHVEPVDIDLPDAIQYFQDFWTPAFTVALDELVEQGWDPAGSPALQPPRGKGTHPHSGRPPPELGVRPRPDRRGLRGRLLAPRLPAHPDHAVRRVPAPRSRRRPHPRRRPGGRRAGHRLPPPDRTAEPRRSARRLRALWIRLPRSARRSADHRPLPR